MSRTNNKILALAMVVMLLVSALALPAAAQGPDAAISFTILHTNDFHGQLEASGSNPGMARVAKVVNDVRAAVGADSVVLVDAGDEMQGSLLSNLSKGAATIDTYKAMGYAAATFGNHEFDWGLETLYARIGQAAPVYPYVTANIVPNPTLADCSTVTWPATLPDGFPQPYVVKTVGTAPNQVKVAFVGVTTQEVPSLTIASATEGLCFKDPANSILHYYDAIKAQADVIVVLSHLGYTDGGYGYGIPVYGDQSLAKKLNDAGKPANLIIGGHTHNDLSAATMVGNTPVVQAHYNGRKVGRADFTFDPATKAVTVAWQRLVISTTGEKDPTIDALIQSYVNNPVYQALVNTPVGYAQTDLLRNYNGDSMMGDFVDDAIYGALNNDAEPANDVDLFFNNAGGIRTDWCDKEDPANPGTYIWSSTASDCTPGVWSHDPMLLNYGHMFTILPFGNATIVGDMTGAQILEVLNQSATLARGAIQPAGLRYKFYRYTDAVNAPGTAASPYVYAWGAYDACVVNKTTQACDPLELTKTYRVGTNEFLAPAGGDLFAGFKYMVNTSYWGDMLNAVNAWVAAHYTQANPYRGPNGDGQLDGRITRDGTDTPDSGSIIPITILHHNDSHGNLVKGTYVAYPQLATLIKQERLHNPDRTLLLNGGDTIQGDAMSYYFKSAGLGYAADGTPLPAALQVQPSIAVMNTMNYDAMDLGNHEFNFGSEIFKSVFKKATFPILGANVTDTGAYGLAEANTQPYIEKTLGGVKVAVLGITNHRVPNYELPSNIMGLTFSDPLVKAQELSDQVGPNNDVVVALTHIGFTEDPKSVEVDKNVDTNMAAQVSGLDAIIGSHSHTNPATGFGAYKFLPTFVAGPDNTPVIINQAYRYNNTLGEIVIGVRAKAGGGYEVMSRAGQYLSVTMSTAEDAAVKAIVDPYATVLAAYNDKVVGQTTAPIDALKAFTEETNAANLQADASVFELAKNGITDVDFHLSGAMTNRKVADAATEASPVTLKVSDMFTLMPYENSLVTMRMNGPQLKAVLERGYRNFYYYKYVPGYGGYSYYTTCMLDINAGGQITYNDLYPAAYDPNVNHVVSLVFDGKDVDFTDADTYYKVSTVNYLAAGSCNFSNKDASGNSVSLWPLNQIVNDTQYYVRDAVIDYITAMGTVSPAIEGRLQFAPPAAVTMSASITQTPAAGLVTLGSDIDVNVKAHNIGATTDAFFYVPLSGKVTYVPGSVYGGAYPVTASAAASLAAKHGQASLAAPEGVAADTVIGVAYEAPGFAPGEFVDFGFHVEVAASDGAVEHYVTISIDGKMFKTLKANSIALAAQDMAAFPALADTYIHSGAPMDNYGASPQLYTRVGEVGNDYQRVLLGFDVTSIKPEYLVEKAVLSVYLNGTSGGAVDGQLQAHEMTTAWTDNTATWKAPWVKPGGDFVETAVAGAPIDKSMVGTWISIDVTPLVTKWAADPASNLGVILRVRKVSSITGYRFASATHWETEHAPKLEVTYRKP